MRSYCDQDRDTYLTMYGYEIYNAKDIAGWFNNRTIPEADFAKANSIQILTFEAGNFYSKLDGQNFV
jgi:hypothetical protein